MSTEAGKRLLSYVDPYEVSADEIAAIEAEAVAGERERIARAEADAPRCPRCGKSFAIAPHWGLCCACVIPFAKECWEDEG